MYITCMQSVKYMYTSRACKLCFLLFMIAGVLRQKKKKGKTWGSCDNYDGKVSDMIAVKITAVVG